jgi:UDP-N-acetylmuramoylalanine--D-glutamate ligase
MKIAILGYDVEGKSSYEYFAKGEHEITICDRNPDVEVPEGVDSVLGDNYLDDLDRFDLLVRTAGLPPRAILEKNPGIEAKISSHINEFLRVCPTKNIIGVTGTKGKGTTSALITNMLEATGHTAHLGGNIGLPPLSFLQELDDNAWVVLELSSFQLIDLQTSPHIGVCVMVVPEHLDWHPDVDEYTQAKTQLFAHQSSEDIAIYFGENETSKQIASVGEGHKIPYFQKPGAHVEHDLIKIDGKEICKTSELRLLGKHNWQNVCAAITAVWHAVAVTQDIERMRSVLTNFTGLPHRLELVRELNGVRYYDDSFGTTPQTAIVAVQAFSEPVIAIIGGRGKGIPFDELGKILAHESNLKNVVAIGETGAEIANELKANGFDRVVEGEKTIEEIVAQAHELASPGDIVLLSAGSASFDMFKNYKDRGEKFTAAVQALS